MFYAIMGIDRDDSLEARMQARSEHMDRLNKLLHEGRLLLAGPHPAIDSEDPGPAGFSGSLIIADFPSLEAAREWAEEDPYILTGVFSSVSVKPFKKTLP
ncbi:YciI family protein [Candidatus Vondammii sp. HM_W22]|uniref:YciI family protein n=1 Tax=Candidatus Vondammii sp. HM_W22 TaxID=2687299 RepID=UPI001F14920D|nr:YciI family protein [Candidatus Vondammii sp. HM_W22]